jgi:hypothetical protein
MKIRTGFVSNSSSSSFLIVGVNNDEEEGGLANQLFLKCVKQERGCEHAVTKNEFCAKCGKPTWRLDDNASFGYGTYSAEGLTFVGRGFDGSYDVYYAGVNAEADLKNDVKVSDIKKKFMKIAKKLGVDVPECNVDLYHGEQSSE